MTGPAVTSLDIHCSLCLCVRFYIFSFTCQASDRWLKTLRCKEEASEEEEEGGGDESFISSLKITIGNGFYADQNAHQSSVRQFYLHRTWFMFLLRLESRRRFNNVGNVWVCRPIGFEWSVDPNSMYWPIQARTHTHMHRHLYTTTMAPFPNSKRLY
jgi:hypothetical protein